MIEIITKYLSFLKLEKRYSPHTQVSYQNDLQQFAQYLELQYQVTDIQSVNSSMVRSWMAQNAFQNMKRTTLNRKLSSLKSFYRFALRHKFVDTNPLLKLSSLSKHRRLPVFLDQEAANNLLDYKGFEANFQGIRDKLIIELLYLTGIRLSELCNLKNSDFNFHESTLKVEGKGSKQRLVPLLREFQQQFEEYSVEKNREFGILSHDYVFVTNKGTPVYPRFVYRKVRRHMGRITTLVKRSPHVLRHTFATHLLNNGAELNAIKEILGHSSLAATQVYTHNSIDKLKSVFKLAHPRA